MNHFPLGIAKGEAFCNRVKERKLLKNNINSRRHMLINAPRRYGKSSLVQKVLNELALPSAKIDLSLVTSFQGVNHYFISAIEQLLLKLQPSYKKAFELAKQTLKHLHPKLILDELGASISLVDDRKQDPIEQLHKTLIALDSIAKTLKQPAIIYVDEFQQLAIIDEHLRIEAAIRSAAQDYEWITCIFTGSNRRLLLNMFDDDSRPFFQLCEKISLHRISNEDYYKHLSKLGQARWQQALTTDFIEKILKLTERHPYYINFLCNKVWSLDKPATIKQLNKLWAQCLEEEQHLLSRSIINLSPSQKSLLHFIAFNEMTQPSSKPVLSALNLSPRASTQALGQLLDNDYVYQDQDGVYRLVNPLLAYYIKSI